ncbi:MAG: cytochrome c biogenesis heme-transporting ATPase CcmA [Candidatus Azotimanducaceae bacterium]|uniref:Cytochrome c biogenesis heme-transporting ATPase CcmA n=1 Tax=OM182 bacterium TaxID=2510334 RepID=A0A520S0P5_9GAMM|nr:heme ABC transporter ATP-binding protein CcmA [Gammaproteobacteria bacterium]OUV68044.1 MAG: heme ABC exporter ATP-binding protein CcmA [Gammaproteobacteria bacterium TMED133]RZO76035.1 MAG: cytochrome c biogenesis heme-transporting ATPase CcmA [OM182 bacterium]
MTVHALDLYMLQVKNLSCERANRVLFRNLSFQVNRGVALRIAGLNGAGKTTLLRILAGLYQEFEGDVKWSLENYPLYIGHRFGVKALMSARENLSWAATINGQEVKLTEIDYALCQVSLEGYADVLCGAMSEGQRGRVGLARLFLLDNPVWILDEPFNAIDSAGIQCVVERIEKHLSSDGILVFSSHLDIPLKNVQELELH